MIVVGVTIVICSVVLSIVCLLIGSFFDSRLVSDTLKLLFGFVSSEGFKFKLPKFYRKKNKNINQKLLISSITY